jgi:hypothetical protein
MEINMAKCEVRTGLGMKRALGDVSVLRRRWASSGRDYLATMM